MDTIDVNDAVEQNCPIDVTIQMIGGKWRLRVIRSLLLHGEQRYNSLLRTVPGVSPKELTRNLRDLETSRLVSRAVRQTGHTVIDVYILTQVGQGLRPAFTSLGEFGELFMRSSSDGPSHVASGPRRRDTTTASAK